MSRFLDYKMVDSKTVMSQVQELQGIQLKIHVEGITPSKTFQVDAITEKQIEVMSMKHRLVNYVYNIESYIKSLRRISLSKIELLNGKIIP